VKFTIGAEYPFWIINTHEGGYIMFKEIRRKDRKLENSEAEELLKRCDYGILSTLNQEGYPYGVPVNYVYLNNALYFHCALEGSKIKNISINSKVSFCVVGKTCVIPDEFTTNYESVVVFGVAGEVLGEEKYNALLEILNKYSKEYLETGKSYIRKMEDKTKVIKIEVEHISGKARK